MKNKTKLPKVLYIGDKWCSGDIKLGVSEWETNLWKSMKSTGLMNLEIFHFDDYYYRFKKLGDEALIKKITKYQPDIICLIIYRIPGSDFNIPTWKTLDIIKNRFKIPIMGVWGDLAKSEQVELSRSLLPYTTINAATETAAAVSRINNPKKYMYMWVPKNPTIFNDPQKERDIDVSYAGYPKLDRLKRINYLVKKGVEVYNHGGESKEHLTTKEYADVFKRSKITLSFSRNDYCHVINARPFEAMNCGAMLLEEENIETAKLFTPFVDYVPYTGKKDLLRKVQYYLEHDKERKRIARNGYEKVTNLYTAKRFWQMMIGRVLKTSSRNTNNLLFLKPSNLSYLSQWKRVKLRFLDTICSNNLGFRVYKTICITSDIEYWKSLLFMLLTSIKIFLKKHLPPKAFKVIHKTAKFIFRIKK